MTSSLVWSLIGALVVTTSCAGATARHASQTPAGAPQDGALRAEQDLVASTCFGRDGRQSEVYDAREFYPWVSVGRLYGVVIPRSRGHLAFRGPGRHAYVAVFGGGATPLCLTGASKEVLAAFLSKQFQGKFPGLESVARIGSFLNDVVLPRGTVVGDQKLLDDQRKYRSWTRKGGRETDPIVFENLCTGIRGSQVGNEWRLQFNAFRPDGGVDSLTAVGGSVPLTITTITVEELKPAGEFSYPIEGWRGVPPNRALQRTALARRR
jgi:hypothetical protein